MPDTTTAAPAQHPAFFLFLCLLMLAAASIGITHHHLPATATSANFAADQFSAARAQQPLQQIAKEPHPTGTAQNAAVRQFLLAQLQQLGLQPQIQQGIGISAWSMGKVSNIVARLPGSKPAAAREKAILLLAHYDSAPGSPGAGDDGASVAAILESLRALKQGVPLQNDVLILLSDGEEAGMLGAQLFASQHAEKDRIGLVLNFEYRGNRGPFWMFEASRGNGKLIAAMQQAVPMPYANSLLYEIYQLMPNYTDFATFKRLGIAGLNFAAGEGHTDYHTRLDTIARLDPASLQHEGSTMLALLRHFGNQDISHLAAADVIYFDLPGLGLVSYSQTTMQVLTMLLTAMTAIALILAWRGGQLRLLRVALASLMQLGSVILVAAAMYLLWQVLVFLHPQYLLQLQGSVYNESWYLAAFPVLALAVYLASLSLWQRFAHNAEIAFGGIVLWLALLLASSIFLPGASFVFAWPLLPVLLLRLALHMPGLVSARCGVKSQAWWLTLSLLPGVILMAPLVRLIFLALTPPLAAVSMALLACLFCLMSPWLQSMRIKVSATRSLSPLAWLSFAVGTLLLLGGSLHAGYDASQPQPSHLAYLYDAEKKQAFWFSRDLVLDRWNQGFFSANPKRSNLPAIANKPNDMLWSGPAPGKLLPPEILITSDRVLTMRHGKVRSIELTIRSPRQAAQMMLRLSGGKLYAVQIAGHRLTTGLQSPWRLPLHGFADDSVHVLLEMELGSKLQVGVLDKSFGLPATGWSPRPADMMPQAFRDSDTSQAYAEIQL